MSKLNVSKVTAKFDAKRRVFAVVQITLAVAGATMIVKGIQLRITKAGDPHIWFPSFDGAPKNGAEYGDRVETFAPATAEDRVAITDAIFSNPEVADLAARAMDALAALAKEAA